jgi:hypothetical protein
MTKMFFIKKKENKRFKKRTNMSFIQKVEDDVDSSQSKQRNEPELVIRW